MKIIIFILISSIPFLSCGQEFNKLDQKGKKTGYWKTFLDENVNPADSTNASFWGYEYYHEGKIVAQKFIKVKPSSRMRLEVEGMQPVKGKPVMVNGVIKWYYTNKEGEEQIIAEDTFKDGFVLTLKEFTDNKLTALMDFTKKYNNLEGSCYITGYYNSEIIQCRWYMKIDNKWKSVETTCE